LRFAGNLQDLHPFLRQSPFFFSQRSLLYLLFFTKMHFTKSTLFSLALLATTQLVAGHSAIVSATGDQGGQGSAIGIDSSTPRDGTRRRPFQQDSTRFRNEGAEQCGETLAGGTNDVQTGTAQVLAENGGTLPQVSPGGQVTMTLHQVNADGAGPYTCMIDATGTGTQWTPIQVTQNIEGSARGRNRETSASDLPLTAAIPAGQTCTGTVAGQANVCMVRCQNPARAGPFGGCVPVQLAAGNETAAAAPAAANNQAANAAAPAANNQAANAAGNAAGNANTANAANAATGNANTANTATGNANTGAGNANTGASNANAANTATGNTAAGNANTANTATGNAATGNRVNNAGTGKAKGKGNGNAGGATPALTNDEEEEEINTRDVTPALTNDEEEEELALLGRLVAKGFKA
jgi:hypothetical protein